ncbi:uncharacterized protein CFAP92 [Eulemur rufifrons]|uniref:uncharacterized protein CFAP92 n=1 Tax=Eulemur rufifrons TaxID=859984 RepID=UPI00374284E7
MSLNAWQWEAEDRASLGPISSVNSLCQSPSECDLEECLKARARAQASDSDFESSSLESSAEPGGGAFNSDMPQLVPCKFVISLAFPVNMAHKGKHTSLLEKYKKHPKMETTITKMRHFYHLEYFLLPGDEEPKEVDVVVFPAVAKVFLESGVKTVKPWREGDKLWVSWAQTFTINMTKELLKKINFHKITLRLWDTKDKLSKKARYYRLKTTAHVDDMGSSEEVRRLVANQRGFSAQDTAKPSLGTEEQKHEHPPAKQEKAKRHSKALRGSNQTEPETPCKNSEECEKSLKTDDPSTVRWSVSRTRAVSLAGATMMEIKELIERPSFSSLTNLLDRRKSQTKGKDSEGKKKIAKRSKKFRVDEDITPAPTGPWKPSVFSLQLAVTPLLAGEQTVVSRGSEKSANILDCLLMLKTDVPIMTEEQKQDLNPLTIKIQRVSCLPAQPVPIQELERLCVPVYCQYRFHETPVHRTEGQPHATDVHFRDINVIFLGAVAPGDLREYLEGPPMAVEVHDRDRKSEEHSRKPALFGDDPQDAHLNSQSLIPPRDTETDPFESHHTARDPYGVARVSFADLLLGRKYLNLAVPIHGCEVQRAPGGGDRGRGARSRRVAAGFRVPTEGAQRGPMPAGHYLEADSVLKVRVDIAVPLSTGAAAATEPQPAGTRFGRIVFVFDVRTPALLHDLLRDVTAINAEALGLASYPARSAQQVLSAFKMRVTIRDRPQLDALTGFHLLDGRVHLLVLEGLADGAVRRLWDSHQSRTAEAEQGGYKVLYNSQLLFRHRLYADLETVLYRVHLFRPVAQLVRHTALYVRKAMPRSAFQAVARIHEICHNSRDLREVIVRDLLPSSAMIKDLSQEFGMPLSQEELAEEPLLALPPRPAPNLEDSRSPNSPLTSEISAHRARYLRWRRAMKLRNRGKDSLIQKNIRDAFQPGGAKPPKPVAKAMKITAPGDKPVCNYSIQTLNATELAKKELYRHMAKEPRKRFTYSQNFLSATVEPVDVEEEERKAQSKSRQAWLTASGFQVTGLKSGGFGGSHQPGLGLPLLKEPSEAWEENALFANRLRPVLDRDAWGWDRRHLDFELYKKPPPFLELPPRPAPKPATGEAGPFAACCVRAWLSRLR